MSKDILVENRDDCPYYGNYRLKNADNKYDVKRHVFEPSAQHGLTRVPVAVWEALLATNKGVNRIASMVEQGRLIPNGHVKASDEVTQQVAMREANYARFVNVYKEVAKMDGKGSEMLAPFVDESGIPDLKLTRENIGRHITGEDHKAFAARLKGEIRDNLHQKALLIPGFVSTKDIDASRVMQPANDTDAEDTSTRFEKLLTEMQAVLPELEEDDFDKAGQPMIPVLKRHGISVSKDDRDYVWKMHLDTVAENAAPEEG